MLKPMRFRDIEWVRKQRNNPECMKWFRQDHKLSTWEQIWWFLTTDMHSAIVWNENKRIGVVSLSHLDKKVRKCEFSIMIIPEHRNKGLGILALKEMLNYAFYVLGMKQVYSDVFEGNPALKTYKKIGFKEYGIFPNWYRKDGEYINSHIISISKDEYNNRLKQTLSKKECREPQFSLKITPNS